MIHLVIPGRAPRKNRRHGVAVGDDGKPRVYNTKRHTSWVGELQAAWGLLPWQARKKAVRGEWMLTIDVYEPDAMTLSDGIVVAKGDDGSATEDIKDALQVVGIIDNDARIKSTTTTKHHDPDKPRVELVLRRWEEAAE